MYALADCNNFFASCERVFRPELNGKPVIVLSNNDGCAVARSNEAKALGIKMGDPLFKIRDIVEKNHVHVFSGNFALYGDMSRRVQEVLRCYSPSIEVYSIDEAFLDLDGMDVDFDKYAKEISRECWRQTSIPVSVGIAPTKTLAKIASKLCKRYPKLKGGCYMHRSQDIEKVLKNFPAEDVWGIGRRMMRRLEAMGVKTAWDYASLPEATVRMLFHLPGYRTWKELKGIPCIALEDMIEPRKTICVSRSFSKEITSLQELSEQIANFAEGAVTKLRSQHSIAWRWSFSPSRTVSSRTLPRPTPASTSSSPTGRPITGPLSVMRWKAAVISTGRATATRKPGSSSQSSCRRKALRILYSRTWRHWKRSRGCQRASTPSTGRSAAARSYLVLKAAERSR